MNQNGLFMGRSRASLLQFGCLYTITDLKFPVNVKVDYYPQTYGNRNVTLWGIY